MSLNMGCVGHSTGAYESVFFSQLHIWLARLTIVLFSDLATAKDRANQLLLLFISYTK